MKTGECIQADNKMSTLMHKFLHSHNGGKVEGQAIQCIVHCIFLQLVCPWDFNIAITYRNFWNESLL